MPQFFYAYILLVTIFACKSETKEHSRIEQQPGKQGKECPPGEVTINLVTIFTKDTAKTPTDRFYSIVSFIRGKELFKPNIYKTGKLKIAKETSKTFPVAYDTCDMKRWITKNFIMENIQVTTLGFTGTKKDRFIGFTPGLHFEEWKFANNTDRDSAMKIVQTAYTYPNNIVMYEKRYSQFMLDDKRIFLLETGAKFAELYAIEYKKLIERFIKTNYNNH
jgi:hypothetical protein